MTRTNEKLVALEALLEQHRDEKVIVYAHLKQNKQAGTRILTDRRKALNLGHKVAENFVYGEVRVVYATSAFGMDIDIPDTAAW